MKQTDRDQTHDIDDNGGLNRRTIIIGAPAVLAAVAAGSSRAQAAADPREAGAGDRIEIIKGALKGQLLRPEMLTIGDKPFEAFPLDPGTGEVLNENRLNRLLVLRLDPAEMDAETAARQVDGVLAYSAICTHRGCTIKSWKAEERHMRCHCHLSEFNALSGGAVMSGPARRQLPMLPLAVDADGYVVASDGFTGRVGASKK
jgi:nitrite reductase/ring-hydroxylating ferredoxin subunit